MATRRKVLAAAASSSVALGINLGFHHNAFGQAVPLRPGFYVLTDSNGVPVGVEVAEHRGELAYQRLVQRIQPIRPVEPDFQDALFQLLLQYL